MDMMKKIFFGLAIVFLPLFNILSVQAEDSVVKIYFFNADGCPHCAKEELFLADLAERYSAIEVVNFEVSKNVENQEIFRSLGQFLDADISGVPFTVVGNQAFSGYGDDQTHGAAIEQAALFCLENYCPDIMFAMANVDSRDALDIEQVSSDATLENFKIPFFGTVNLKSFSLPLLTIILGALDGFNPCAMWALIFLIGLLLGMKDRKKMWILGGAFIVTSALVYYLFLVAWLNVLLFIGLIFWVRLLIALVALGGGIYSLKDFFTNKDAVCNVGDMQKKQETFSRLRNVVKNNNFWLALGGIIILAAAVNMIELICSAGIPAVYTQVLTMNDLPTWHYYMYILLYIFIFMLDDLIIFFLAMLTLQASGFTTKYSRFSRLLGGILMVLIGLLLIFKPAWLMFG
ncbi:hypothetical protein H6761_03015 [Candidatus Nomurabacteria bacterium]|nr:hypothetical protein [Candidatus Nomurabacteria bacterium]